MSSEGVVAQIDSAIASYFGSGNIYTIFLAGALVVTLLWPILTGKDPDIHPFLLARQAQASPVRQPGESAVYRANEIPYGYPLRRGLGVKDVGAPAWSAGRDGDLRDVWRKAAAGAVDEKGSATGQKAKLLTVLGREKVVEQSVDQVTQAINAIGSLIKEKGGKTVAVSLSNSVELLATVFASAFYDFKPVLIPYGLDQAKLQSLLSKVRADALIAEAATVELQSALSVAPSIKSVIWVVQEASRDIDWSEKPDGVGQIDFFQWHDIVSQRKASSEVPASEKDSKTGPIATFWKGKGGQYDLVEYTAETLVAGTGGLLSTLVREHRITDKDTLLSTASLTESYALCWTLAALYSNASIALNSVAGDSIDLTLAAVGVSPTIIVSSAGTITKHHEKIAAFAPGIPQKVMNYFAKRDMTSGYMSTNKPSDPTPNLSKLRVLLVSQRDTEQNDRVKSSVLAGLRLALATRTAYALTASAVAGAVSQTNIFDYREKGSKINVGVPVSSIELFVTGDDQDLDQDIPKGRVVVRGPAVTGGKAELNVSARIDVDRTITLL